MNKMNTKELQNVLNLHQKWLNGDSDGVGANLYRANLYGVDLPGADLTRVNLTEADLTEADLPGTNLSRANLSRANLPGADLTEANLSMANLTGANLPITAISISRIGSRNGMTTYVYEWDKVFVGCWTGTLAEFQARIEKTHKDNPKYLLQYRAAITMFETLKGK